MNELEGRLELLTTELSELQQGIRGYDMIRTQVQGWAVTVGLAAAGLALTAGTPAAAYLGVLSSATFFAIDAQRRLTQRHLINRCLEIERSLSSGSLAEALSLESPLRVPWVAHHMTTPRTSRRYPIGPLLTEAGRPTTWALYATLAIALVIAGLAAG